MANGKGGEGLLGFLAGGAVGMATTCFLAAKGMSIFIHSIVEEVVPNAGIAALVNSQIVIDSAHVMQFVLYGIGSLFVL